MGNTASRGLGLFHGQGFSAGPLTWPHDARYFLNRRIAGVPISAVWAHRSRDDARHYIGQMSRALDSRAHWLGDPACIVAGDFNSSPIWDRPRRHWGHTPTMRRLEALGLRSAYHAYHAVAQGSEGHPTFYLQRNQAKPYHIDYVMVGRAWRIKAVQVGNPEDWLSCSDHMPVSVRLVRADS